MLSWLAHRSSLALLGCVMLLGACAISPELQPHERADVAGKTVVVTGASSGFGRGVALQLAGMGANVVLAARRAEVLEDVAREASALGGVPLAVVTDVSRPEDVEALVAAAVERFGRIDVWINNAGVGAIGRFEDIPVADHARVIDVNLKGVVYGSHVALRQFRRQGAGTLVNIGSVESVLPLAYQATYAATKAAVLSLGRTLNEELRLSGAHQIAVATVLPWAADTPFFQHAANYSGGTPRMAAIEDPRRVVDAIVWISFHPREELPVGWKAAGAVLSHRLMPDVSEWIAADIGHRWQIETAPPAPDTSGTLHVPMAEGTAVEGGVRQRIEREE